MPFVQVTVTDEAASRIAAELQALDLHAEACCIQVLIRDRQDALAVLEEARQSLIDHAVKLPLSRRDHGPVLYKIDAFVGRIERPA